MLSLDYGITVDEMEHQIYGEKILSYLETGGEDKTAISYKNYYTSGGLFDFSAAFLNKYIFDVDSFKLRHFLNALAGFLLVFFTGLLAREVSNSWRIAFFALLFMVLSPRIFGHAMNNPTAIPFATAYVFTLLHLVRFLKQLPKPGSKTILMLAVGIALAINVHVGGLLLIAYFVFFTGAAYLVKTNLRNKLSRSRHLVKIGTISLFICIFGYFAGQLFWPYALHAPFSNPFKALHELPNLSNNLQVHFAGEHLWTNELPWFYTPQWLAITTPVFVIFGFILFCIFYLAKQKQMDFTPLFLLVISIFPVSFAIFKNIPLNEGMRQFIFIYPGLVILAAWGWNELMLLKKMRWIASGLLIVLMTFPTFWMIKNHPYQYTYFNEPFGGLANAYGKYEMDYWMLSLKKLSNWLIENDPKIKNGEPLIIQTNGKEPASYYFKDFPNVKVEFVTYENQSKVKGDYFIFHSKIVNSKQLTEEAWPPEEVIYAEKAGEVILGVILKGN